MSVLGEKEREYESVKKGNTIENLRFNSCHMHCILCTMCLAILTLEMSYLMHFTTIATLLNGNNNFIVNNSEQWPPRSRKRRTQTMDSFIKRQSYADLQIDLRLSIGLTIFRWLHTNVDANQMNRRRDRRSINQVFRSLPHCCMHKTILHWVWLLFAGDFYCKI